MAQHVGIDFGTSYCCVAIVKSDQSEVVADSQGERHIPGFVGFYPDSDHLVGREAESRLGRYWQNTVFDLKLLLGTSFEDALSLKSRWGFKIVPAKKGLVAIELETTQQEGVTERFAPEQIVAKILSKLKETAEEALHHKVTSACISIPVNMTQLAREALMDASKQAGITEVSFIPDPVSCVMAYQQDQPDSTGIVKQIVVVDFGASLNVSLVTIQNGLIRIRDTQRASLSTLSIEKELMNHFGSEFKRKTGFDYTESRKALFKLQSECERVKKDLSQMAQTNIQLDGFYEGCDLTSNMTRARFEAVTENIFKSIIAPIQTVVNTAGGVDKISSVIFSGGSIKIPRVQQLLKQFFGADVPILCSIDPSDVIARGAALQGLLISNRNPTLKQKQRGGGIGASSGLGGGGGGGGGSSSSTAVCTSLCIGLGLEDGSFLRVIPSNTPLPTKIIKHFGVAQKQTKLFFSVYEGEDTVTKNNHLLAEFVYNCQGNSSVRVSFLMDVSGNLKIIVSQGNENNQHQTIFKIEGGVSQYKRLNSEEVQKMKNPPQQ